jgi:hypothetical protein
VIIQPRNSGRNVFPDCAGAHLNGYGEHLFWQ